MPVTRKQKEETVKKLKDKLNSSDFIAFLNFHGMNVANASEFRRALRKIGADYFVAKKTLLGVALRQLAEETGLEIDKTKLDGEIALAFAASGEDSSLATAKEIATFSRKNSEILKATGGFWAKRWIDATEIKRLATIPPREALLTQLAFMLSQPVASLARSLNAVADKLKENK